MVKWPLGRKRKDECRDRDWVFSSFVSPGTPATTHTRQVFGNGWSVETIRSVTGGTIRAAAYDPNGNLLRWIIDGRVVTEGAFDDMEAAGRFVEMICAMGR
jgi:hypothetical protein